MALQFRKIKLLLKVLLQATCLLDKTNQWNFKIWPFLPVGKKFANIFWLIWKQRFSFFPNFSWSFSVIKSSSCESFGYSNLPFRQNKPINFENSTLPPCRKEIQQFWGVWFENHDLVFPQTFHGPSVLQKQAPVKIFGWGNLSFAENKPIKFENSTLPTCCK